MIFLPVVNEACRVLDEGIAVKAADLDVSAVMGMGFPPYRYAQIINFKEKFIVLSSVIHNNSTHLPGEDSYSGLILSDQSISTLV